MSERIDFVLDQDPFQYLGSFCAGEKESIQTGLYEIEISRHRDPGMVEDYLAVSIREMGRERWHDEYIITQDGVQEMFFEFPPLVKVFPAPTLYPADMTEKQMTDLARRRAIQVAAFIGGVVSNSK